jgi:hypothetical protein
MIVRELCLAAPALDQSQQPPVRAGDEHPGGRSLRTQSEYAASTHAGAFVAHLVYGLAVASVRETGWKLLGRR